MTTRQTIERDFSIAVRWDEPRTGFRAWLATALRRAADRTDGRRSMAVLIETAPALPPDVIEEVLHQGVLQIVRSVRSATMLECFEEVFREQRPELFNQGKR